MELMVVLAILAMLAGGGVYMVGLVTHGQLKDEAMRLSSAMRYTSNQAALNNRQYRLIIDFENNEYFTEVTDSDVVIDGTDEEAQQAFDDGLLPEEVRQMERERQAQRGGGLFDDKEADPFGLSRRTGFERAEDSVVKPRTLRHGIRFESVRTENRRRPIEDGRAAIHFFPNGLQQQAQIVLRDPSSEARFTLITEPLTGRIIAYSGLREVPDDFGEEEHDG